MNEDDLLQFHRYMAKEGYEMGTFANFTEVMTKEENRKQLYDYFGQEGYELGQFEKFVYSPTPAASTPKGTPAQSKINPAFSPKPTDKASLTVFPEFEKTLEDGLSFNEKMTAYSDAVSKAQRPVPGEQETIESPLGARKPVEEVVNFVTSSFTEQPPQVQQTLTEYITNRPDASALLTNGNMNEKQRAELVESALRQGLETAYTNYETLKNRIDLKGGEEMSKVRALVQFMQETEATPENEEALRLADAELKKYQGTDELKLLQAEANYDATFSDYSNILKKYPKELERRKKIERKKEQVTIQPTDSAFTKGIKTAKSTVGALGNAAIDGVVNVVETSKALSDLTQSQFRDVGTYDNSDRVAESISGFMEGIKLPTNTDTDGSALNYIPAVAKTMGDMAVMFLGSKGLSAAGVGNNTALVLSGMNVVYGDTYETMREAGLEDETAIQYATGAALVQGLLERVSPQEALRKNLFKEAIKKVENPANAASVWREVVRDIPGENVQEFMQTFADLGINMVINSNEGTSLKTDMSGAEVFDQIALTTAATALMGGLSGKAAYRGKQKEAAAYLQKNRERYIDYLQSQVENGTITVEQAGRALSYIEENAPTTADEANDLLQKEIEFTPAGFEIAEPPVQEVQEVQEEAKKSPFPEEGEVVTFKGDKFKVVGKSRGKLTLQSEDGSIVIPKVPQLDVQREGGPTIISPENYKNEEQGQTKETSKTPKAKATKKDQTSPKAKREPVRGPEAVTTPVAQSEPTVESLAEPEVPEVDVEMVEEQPTTKQSTKTAPLESRVTTGDTVTWGGKKATVKENPKSFVLEFEDGTTKRLNKGRNNIKKLETARAITQAEETTITEPEPTEISNDFGPLYEVDRTPEVGDIVEYDGDKFEVMKITKGKMDLRSADRKGGAKGVTNKEIGKTYAKTTEQTQGTVAEAVVQDSNDTGTNQDPGAIAKINIKGKPVEVLEIGPESAKIRRPNGSVAIIQGKQAVGIIQNAVDLYNENKKLSEGWKDVKDAWGEFNAPGAVYDPKNEADKQIKLFNALKNYAVQWIKVKGKEGWVKFSQSIPKELRDALSDDFIKAAYEGKDTFTDAAVRREIEEEAQKGNKERKSTKRLVEQTQEEIDAEVDATIDPELMSEIERKGLKYFAEPLSVTDAAVDTLLQSVPIDKVRDQFLNDTGDLTPAMRTLLGIKLLQRYNKMAKSDRFNNDNAREKAMEIAEGLVQLGTEYGRAINAFKALTLLTPEGLQLWSNKALGSARDNILVKHSHAINRVVAKVNKAKAEAAQQVPLDQYGIAELKAKKADALKRFKEKMAQAGSFPNPAASKELLEYAFYTIAEGVQTLKQFVGQMKKIGVDAKAAEALWNTPFNGQPLKDHADKVHIPEIQKAIGTDKLVKVLEKYGYDIGMAVTIEKAHSKAVLEALQRSKRRTLTSRGLDGKIVSELLKMDGPYDKDAVEKALLKVRGFRGMDADLQAEVEKRAEKIEKLPEGFLRDREAKDLANLIADRINKQNVSEMYISLWYASILSGPATHLVNATGSIYNTAFEVSISTIQDIAVGKPGRAGRALLAMGKGYARGAKEAWAILKEGEAVNKASSKYYEANPLEELSPRKQGKLIVDRAKRISDARSAVDLLHAVLGVPVATVAPIAKFVPRMLAATDTFFYYGLYNHRQEHFARTIANGDQKVYDDIMGNNNYKEALTLAKQEAADLALDGIQLSNLDITRRASEIVEMQITDPRVKIAADRFASRATFNYPPEGAAGVVARAMAQIGEYLPPFKLIIPFTNIVANVINQQLDYTPLGIARAARINPSRISSKPTQYVQDPREAGALAIKGVLGTLLTSLLFFELWDEDDNYGRLTGKGPKDPVKRAQMYDRGWRPFSYETDDGRFLSYQYTPLALVFTVIGNVADGLRYDGTDKETIERQMVLAFWGMPGALLEMSFLKSAAEFLEEVQEAKSLERWFSRFSARSISSFSPSFLRSVSKAFDPTVYESRDFKEALVKGLPFAPAYYGTPKLNNFGEPTEYKLGKKGEFSWPLFLGADRFASDKDYSSKATELLAENGLFVPPIKSATINGQSTNDNPTMLRDYRMIVGQLFKKDLERNYLLYKVDPELKKTTESVFREIRQDVKDEYENGLTTDLIIQKYGLTRY